MITKEIMVMVDGPILFSVPLTRSLGLTGS